MDNPTLVAPRALIAMDVLTAAHVVVRCFFCGAQLMEGGYRVVRLGQEAVMGCAPACRDDYGARETLEDGS